MSDSGFPRVQVSKMMGKDQVVLRGDSVTELEDLAKSIAGSSGALAESFNVIEQVLYASQVMNSPVNPSSAPSQTAQPATDGPSCKHGPRETKRGEKNGKAWVGYFCTESNRNEQCAAVWGK